MRTVDVTLAGKTYQIQALPMKQSRAWRQRLEGPFAELAQLLEGAGSIELTNGLSIARLVRMFSGTLIGSMDMLLELLFAYSPVLEQDREHIEENGYDEEALQAFTEVLKLAYPFGVLSALVTGRMANKT